jgi:hypothetical protein
MAPIWCTRTRKQQQQLQQHQPEEGFWVQQVDSPLPAAPDYQLLLRQRLLLMSIQRGSLG